MEDFCNCIENRVVYPISIKNNKSSYLTLYYYTERSDSILHNDAKNLLYFRSKEEMECFCKINELTIENWQLTIMVLALRTDFRAQLPKPYHSERSKASSGLGSPFGRAGTRSA